MAVALGALLARQIRQLSIVKLFPRKQRKVTANCELRTVNSYFEIKAVPLQEDVSHVIEVCAYAKLLASFYRA